MRTKGTGRATSDRRHQRTHQSRRTANNASVVSTPDGHEKSSSRADDHAWEHCLPQPLDDRTVQGSVKTLLDQAQLHVENFYTNADVKITQGVAANLARVQTPHLTESVASVIESSRSPLPVLKHCLIHMITQSMSIDTKSDNSLLPPEYAALVGNCSIPSATDPSAVGEWCFSSTAARSC